MRTTVIVPTRARHTLVAPSASYQAYDVYRSAMSRPTSNRIASAMADAISQRRWVISDGDALLAQPAFHLAANLGQSLFRPRFVARDDDWLRVRRADQPPSVAEQHANS